MRMSLHMMCTDVFTVLYKHMYIQYRCTYVLFHMMVTNRVLLCAYTNEVDHTHIGQVSAKDMVHPSPLPLPFNDIPSSHYRRIKPVTIMCNYCCIVCESLYICTLYTLICLCNIPHRFVVF